MLHNKSKIILYGLVIALTFSACGSPPPVPLPTFDVNHVIARTAAAAQTGTAISLPTATITLTPTVTPTVLTPTPTGFFDVLNETPSIPYETVDPNLSIESSLPGFLPTKKSSYDFEYSGEPWSCVGVGRYPPNGQVMPADKPFVATWTVVNNGQRDWTQNIIDFVYKSGYRHTGYRIQDLDRYISSGRSITLLVDFVAPKAPGTYYAIWQLKVGSNGFCGIQFEFAVSEDKRTK